MTTLARNIFALAACLLLAFPNAIAGEKQHEIDVWLKNAIEKDSTTAGMRNATNHARDLWDQEMNRAYSDLMARLSVNQKAILKNAQRNWLKFRDSELEAIGSLVASKEGTMWQTIATGEGMQLVRRRALQLRAYEYFIDK